MNQWTWEVAPRGKKQIKMVTLGETYAVAKESALAIAYDVWPNASALNQEINGELLKVEQIAPGINVQQVFHDA